MIPTIEDILDGYKNGSYTQEQCLGWINQHIEGAVGKANESDLRDSFAMAALTGLQPRIPTDSSFGERAYAYADQMMEARKIK